MRYFLMPEDERLLVDHLTRQEGLGLLLSDHVHGGGPRMAAEPLRALLEQLPGPAYFRSHDAFYLRFWAPNLGPLVLLGDAGGATDAKGRVGRFMAQSASPRWTRAVDGERSQLVVWRRCSWQPDGRLRGGALQGIAAPSKFISPTANAILRSTERWLRRSGEEFDMQLWDGSEARPSLRRAIAFALPGAWAWLQSGGRVALG